MPDYLPFLRSIAAGEVAAVPVLADALEEAGDERGPQVRDLWAEYAQLVEELASRVRAGEESVWAIGMDGTAKGWEKPKVALEKLDASLQRAVHSLFAKELGAAERARNLANLEANLKMLRGE